MLARTLKATALSLALTFAFSTHALAVESNQARRAPTGFAKFRKPLAIAAALAIPLMVGGKFYTTSVSLDSAKINYGIAQEHVANVMERAANTLAPEFKILQAQMNQESQAIKDVAAARAAIGAAKGNAQALEAANAKFATALSQVVAIGESDHAFKSDATIAAAFKHIKGIYTDVNVERDRATQVKKDYNRKFVGVTGWVARSMGYQPMETAVAPALNLPAAPPQFEAPSFE